MKFTPVDAAHIHESYDVKLNPKMMVKTFKNWVIQLQLQDLCI